jgi:hypothetical protein
MKILDLEGRQGGDSTPSRSEMSTKKVSTTMKRHQRSKDQLQESQKRQKKSPGTKKLGLRSVYLWQNIPLTD